MLVLCWQNSGPLQVEFLSGVLCRPILQVGEIQADNMNSKKFFHVHVTTVLGTKAPLAIMWLRFQPTSAMFNHIAPLIPGSSKLIPLYFIEICCITLCNSMV